MTAKQMRLLLQSISADPQMKQSKDSILRIATFGRNKPLDDDWTKKSAGNRKMFCFCSFKKIT